ncbi:nitroreductase family protein [Tritrichomonas foetus]|uniref:Nitroreductase family protein n=1 Tax=Tritrichomonas foetus TaxID=1144522 RepID=A0A1J4K0A8_9EUKA|nr:nitroreductase family protein [Tritrichomonas foetus]|eukprot:OHT04667.1 nitroreductase family protein [Tritrichomonas foetus]
MLKFTFNSRDRRYLYYKLLKQPNKQLKSSLRCIKKMDVIEALKTRRTVRQFEPDYTIPRDQLQQIVDVALISPTGRNLQGLDLVVCTNRQKLDEATKITFDSWPEDRRERWTNRKQDYGVKNVVTCDASCVIFLVSNERADEQFLNVDAGIVSMAIMAAAREFDLHTMCIGALLWGDKAGLEASLGIETGKLVMAVAIGKAKEGFKVSDKQQLAKARFIE